MAERTGSDATGPDVIETHSAKRGHTLLELTERDDGTWIATQFDVDVTGTGETAALAAMDYCRRIARGEHRGDPADDPTAREAARE